MKALVYHGPGQKRWEEVPDPTLVDDTDAIVRVDATTICGTDLGILRGNVATAAPGLVLGHEAVGTIERIGSGVRERVIGDRVLVPCITSCGRCAYCRQSAFGQCLGGGGWILGHRIAGTQAERVRVPFADTSTHLIPEDVPDEHLLMLADILPTGYEVGVLLGRVEPGSVVVVVGAGPVGLAAMATAQLLSPSMIVAVDLDAARLDAARRFGATVTIDGTQDVLARILELTDGLGADVAIEAVGLPATFEQCTRMVRPGGRVANAGVHGRPVTFHLDELWSRSMTVSTAVVDTSSVPTLLRLLVAGRLDASAFVSHRFALRDILAAYDVVERAAATGARKVLLTP